MPALMFEGVVWALHLKEWCVSCPDLTLSHLLRFCCTVMWGLQRGHTTRPPCIEEIS